MVLGKAREARQREEEKGIRGKAGEQRSRKQKAKHWASIVRPLKDEGLLAWAAAPRFSWWLQAPARTLGMQATKLMV